MIIRMGAVVSKAAGSLGGITFSNRSGVSICSLRPRKSRKQTTAQLDQQCAHAQAIAAWHDLTAAQRLAWNLYAYRAQRVNRVGVFRRIGGFQFFVSQATIRIAAGIAAPTGVPKYGQQGVGAPAGILFTEATSYLVYWYSPTTDPHGHFILSGSRPMSETSSRKPYWHVFPAFAVEDYAEMDVMTFWDAVMGPLAAGERYLIRIRYAGENSLVSAHTHYTGVTA